MAGIVNGYARCSPRSRDFGATRAEIGVSANRCDLDGAHSTLCRVLERGDQAAA